MSRFLRFATPFALCALLIGPVRVGAQEPAYRPGELIVKFKRGVSGAARAAALGASAASVRSFGLARARRASLGASPLDQTAHVFLAPGVSPVDAAKALSAHPDVEYAEPNYLVSIDETFPDDPRFGEQYSLHNTGQTFGTADADVDAPAGWDVETGTRAVVIAIIDTGTDYNHPDLAANIWENEIEKNGSPGVDDDGNGVVDDVHGADFFNGDGDPMDDHSHGTHVAGIAAAVGNNGVGIAGMAWSARLMAVKFLGASGTGDTGNGILSIYYAVDNGADILNNSWGGSGASQALQDAIDYARANGVVVIGAAGNFNTDSLYRPGGLPGVIGVSSTDHDDLKSSFSNFGPYVDVAAPGTAILSTVLNSTYGFKNGTSMATPHVSGLAALLKSRNPSLSRFQIESLLLTTADDLGFAGWDTSFGNGRLNAGAALAALESGNVDFARAEISSPTHGTPVSGTFELIGSADQAGFARYTVNYKARSQTSWTLAHQSASPVTDGVLASIDVSALASGQYHFRVTSEDASGRRQSHVQELLVDNTPPTVVILDPDEGDNVGGTITVVVDASDSSGISHVELYIDGELFGVKTTPLYNFEWDTFLVDEGTHTLLARGYDVVGLLTTDTVTVNVVRVDESSPTVTITNPAPGQEVTGTIPVRATATDNFGVDRVEFRVDGVLAATDAEAPYEFSWNASAETLGSHDLRATAYDAAGNSDSDEIAVTVTDTDSIPPEVAITAPAAGATVSGLVDVTVSAVDNVGVAKVTLLVDEQPVGEKTAAPYAFEWDSSGRSGVVRLLARAEDGAGNVSYASITVTADNDDTEAPTVSISQPGSLARVRGTVEIRVAAADNVGVTLVQYFVDGALRGSHAGAPAVFEWNASAERVGTRILEAKAFDAAGNSAVAAVQVDVAPPAEALPRFRNLFNPAAGEVMTVPFVLETAGRAELVIYDRRGAVVRRLLNETRPAGEHVVDWDGRNDEGGDAASAFYLLVLKRAGDSPVTRKIFLVR